MNLKNRMIRKVKDARQVEVYSFDELDEETQREVVERYGTDIINDRNAWDANDFRATVEALCEKYNLEEGRDYVTDLSFGRYDYYFDEYVLNGVADENADESYETVKAYVEDHTDFNLDDWGLTGTYADDAACEYIKKVLSGAEQPSTIDEFVEDLGYAVRNQWERNEEYNAEFEQVAEEISNNEWEFTANGIRV